jgi:hypothetical protein
MPLLPEENGYLHNDASADSSIKFSPCSRERRPRASHPLSKRSSNVEEDMIRVLSVGRFEWVKEKRDRRCFTRTKKRALYRRKPRVTTLLAMIAHLLLISAVFFSVDDSKLVRGCLICPLMARFRGQGQN